MTLIELMLGIAIFSMAAIALVPSVLSTRKASEANIYHSSILTVVTGFVEQTKAMSFSELEDIANGDASTLEYVISSDSSATLTHDVESVLVIPIDADSEGTTTITADLYIRIKLSPITGLDAVQLDIQYGYEKPLTERIFLSSISSIISNVPTF
ncbi:MAG: type II secretion system protein [Opitutales bacterium]